MSAHEERAAQVMVGVERHVVLLPLLLPELAGPFFNDSVQMGIGLFQFPDQPFRLYELARETAG